MKAIPLFVGKETGLVRATLTGGVLSATAILGTALEFTVTFFNEDNEAVELAEGATGGLYCRAANALDGDDVLLDAAWAHTAGQTTYTLKTLADSVQLRAAGGKEPSIILRAQIEFHLPDEDEPRKSLPFDLTVILGPARGDAGVPDPVAEASEAWLAARAPRINVAVALSAEQRTQLLTNIGNAMQMRLSADASYVHLYTPAGIYKGSLQLLDLGQADL